jgi:hypothetical protein
VEHAKGRLIPIVSGDVEFVLVKTELPPTALFGQCEHAMLWRVVDANMNYVGMASEMALNQESVADMIVGATVSAKSVYPHQRFGNAEQRNPLRDERSLKRNLMI